MLDPTLLRKRLLSSGLATEETIVPCSELEIARLETTAPDVLPDAYKAFLRTAGRKAGLLFSDVNFFYPGILDLTERASGWLREFESPLALPERAFVFSDRYGEQFMYFLVDGDDPPIFLYVEGRTHFERIADSVWEIIEAELLEVEEFKRKCYNTPAWDYFVGGQSRDS